MIRQASVTESQIIYLNELYITGLYSGAPLVSEMFNVNWEEMDFYFIFIHFKDFSVAAVNLSQILYQKALLKGFPLFQFQLLLLWITCPALFPPPHFGTLSKIQKGGEPVPHPVEEQCCLRRSVYKWNETPWHVCMCAVLCLVHVFVCTVCHLVNTCYTYCHNGLQPCPFVLFEVGSTLIKSKWIKKLKKKSKKLELGLKKQSSCHASPWKRQ